MHDPLFESGAVKSIKRVLKTHPFPTHGKHPERINRILEKLQEVWRRHPDLRLAQLLVITSGATQPCPELFNFEDDALLHALEGFELGSQNNES